MGSKRKRNLNERLKAKEEKVITKIDEDERLTYTRKISDDYSDKIIKDIDKFQDKHHEKLSKRVNIDDETVSRSKSKKAIKRNFLNERKEAKASSLDYETEGKENRIYDPLAKDQDNDGVVDRYDNDFRDSNVTYESLDGKNTKFKDKQKKIIKRKNYSDKLFTRLNEDKKNEPLKNSDYSIDSFSLKDKSKKKSYDIGYKENIASKGVKTAAILTEVTSAYLSSCDDDNASVKAAEKSFSGSSKLLHGAKSYSDKRKNKKLSDLEKQNTKLKKKQSKLEFRKSVDELNKTEAYKKMDVYKKFQKKRQMKASIYKEQKLRIRDRLKKAFLDTVKFSKEIVLRKTKMAAIIIVAIIILGTFMLNFVGITMGGLANSTSSILYTSYLSSPNTLMEINQSFTSKEEGLQDELESVEENHPGYDEYIIRKNGKIGHNVHELLSYITSRYGEVKSVSEVSSILDELFHEMYSVSYKEEIEIRYKTVTDSYIDEDGNEHKDSHEEPYEYKKLIVTLNKKEMDYVIRKVFDKYPDNILHYDALLSSLGNMGDFFGSGSNNTSEIIKNPTFGNPGLAFNEESVKVLFNEAEKHIGKRYVFGANGPHNFDCSSFVCWSFTRSGIKNMPRTTAWRIYTDYCNPVRVSEAKAGDIIFFKNTYNSGSPISHVGIYAGDGMMIHAGDPIQYTSINSAYWREHFYGFGRPR